MNKRLFKLLSFVFMLVLALPLAAKSAFAETASTEAATGTPKAVVATITDFRVEDRFGNPTTVVNKANVYAIAMTWDASANANVEPGDYFDVTLPNEMRFTAAHPASTFNITDAATGEVMAVAHVTPGTDGFGGNMRVVFTNYVNNHTELRGTARLGFTISNNRIQSGNNKTVNFTVSGRIVPVTFDLTEPGTIGTEYLSKWGKIIEGNANEIQWTGRINYSGGNFHNVRLHDQLSDQGGGDLLPGAARLDGPGHVRTQLGGGADGGDGHEADELALGDVEAAAGGEVAEGGGGQQVGHELVEGLRQGGEDLLDLVAVQRGLNGGAGLLAGAGVGGVDGAGVLQGQGDAVGLEDPVGDVDGVERLGEADEGCALVDGLADFHGRAPHRERRPDVDGQLGKRLIGCQNRDGYEFSGLVVEIAGVEDFAEDEALEDPHELRGVAFVDDRFAAEELREFLRGQFDSPHGHPVRSRPLSVRRIRRRRRVPAIRCASPLRGPPGRCG